MSSNLHLVENVPRTKLKILLASILYRVVRVFFRSPIVVAQRKGIRYALELSEGIDLAIFLFGGFQRHVYTNHRLAGITGEATIIDVGANMGCMSLMFAKQFPDAQIHAFEPTSFGVNKFQRNLELNPELASQIILVQQFVSDVTMENPKMKAYASWKVDGSSNGMRHPIHWGTIRPTEGIASITLDSYCVNNGLRNVRLIKIDTDGHEFQVLKGACGVIASQRPLIIFELGQYVMTEQGIDFSHYLMFFRGLAYEMHSCVDGVLLDSSNWRRKVPKFGTIDVLAVPSQNVNACGGDVCR
jgi:FkbM family methyltransferase